MSFIEASFHHERILYILFDFLLYKKINTKYYVEKFEVSKTTIKKDINLIKEFLIDQFGDDIYIVYNRKQKNFELIVIKGKLFNIDLPFKI